MNPLPQIRAVALFIFSFPNVVLLASPGNKLQISVITVSNFLAGSLLHDQVEGLSNRLFWDMHGDGEA